MRWIHPDVRGEVIQNLVFDTNYTIINHLGNSVDVKKNALVLTSVIFIKKL